MSHGCLKFCSRALTRKQPHLCLLLHFPKVEAIANMPAASPFPTPACSTHEPKSLCVPEQLQAERPSPVASGSGCNYAWPDPSSLPRSCDNGARKHPSPVNYAVCIRVHAVMGGAGSLLAPAAGKMGGGEKKVSPDTRGKWHEGPVLTANCRGSPANSCRSPVQLC